MYEGLSTAFVIYCLHISPLDLLRNNTNCIYDNHVMQIGYSASFIISKSVVVLCKYIWVYNCKVKQLTDRKK